MSPERRAYHREWSRKWRAENPDKVKAANAKCRAKHRLKYNEAQKGGKHLGKYGISLEEKACILERQGFVCAICGSDDPQGKAGWCTDHCHSSGAIRGVLCQACNKGLGFFRDNPAFLSSAINYLNRSH